MDYRKNEGFIRQSSSLRLRDSSQKVDRLEAPQRSLPRSVSPNRPAQEASARPTMGSVEPREYGWPPDRKSGRVRSRSPPISDLGDSGKRPHYDNALGNQPGNFSPSQIVELRQTQRHDSGEGKNLQFTNYDAGFRTSNAYEFDRNNSRISKEEYDELSLSAGGGKHPELGQNAVAVKDSRAMSNQHFEQGRTQYQEALCFDSLPVNRSYRDGDQPMIRSRDGMYRMVSGPEFKANSSSEMMRHENMSYQDNPHIPGFNRNDLDGSNEYREQFFRDSARDPECGQRNSRSYLVRKYIPDRDELENYSYPLSRFDDCGNSADDYHKMVASKAHPEHDRTQIIYDRNDVSRNNHMDGSGGISRQGITYYQPALEKQANSDYIDMRRAPHSMLKHDGEDSDYIDMRRAPHNMPKHNGADSGYTDMRRAPHNVPKHNGVDSEYVDMRSAPHNVLKHNREYLGPGFSQHEIRRQVSDDHDAQRVVGLNNRRRSGMEADYGFEGDSGPQFQTYENEMIRHDVRTRDMRNDNRIYTPQDRMMRGKYIVHEDHPRTYKHIKNDEDWSNGERKKMGFEHTGYRRRENNYDGMGDHEDLQSDEWFSPQQLPNGQSDEWFSSQELPHGRSDEWFSSQELPPGRKQTVRFYKPYNQQFKGNRKPGYVNYHHNNPNYYDRKDHFHRQQNQNNLYRNRNYFERKNHFNNQQQRVWNNDEDHREDLLPEGGTKSTDPPEDSEEFMQLVHEAFLKFSRILNVNPAVQRRYKEEGRAGSLFCNVCGRSLSKEFMDTRRLGTHAFMSRKPGLRTDHLGLHKAICVLMGWNTIVPEGTVMWVPQVLSKARALAQKEDLILWPPVIVVHNISFSDTNPEKWNVVTVEALEAFIRSKGLIKGRVKVCIGKFIDQSVMIVKFLGTFSGLGDAEKLHKYFLEQSHGRVDFELAISRKGEMGINKEEKNAEEKILYGYLGTSEDLGKVDYITKNTGLVKSKIAIQELANDPVKTEEALQ